MCRFTAYRGAPLPISTLVFGGDHSLHRQSWAPDELLSGSVNADGWGAAWWHAGQAVRLARAAPVWYDPDVEGVLASMSAPLALAAVRNATPGSPVDRTSVPPLTEGHLAFVLNGYVPRFHSGPMWTLRRELPDDVHGRLRGGSDAETLLLVAAAALESGEAAGPGEALVQVVDRVLATVREDAGGAECQLTMALADGERLAVCRTSNVERTNSLYVCEGGTLAPEGTLVASERLETGAESAAWRPVTPHSVVEIDAQGAREHPLRPPEQSRG